MERVQDSEARRRVVDSIGALLPRVLDQDVTPLSEDTRLFDELGMSSTKTLELLLALEEDLDIHVELDEVERKDLESVGSLVDFVTEHTTAGA